MPHNFNGNPLPSLLLSATSGITYMFSQVNVYTLGIPNILLQSVSLLAGMVAICSGILAIRKNLRK